MRGFVYAISAGPERHKIGRAKDPRSRLQSLQCGVPDTLALVHTVEVGSMVRAEASAHERLRERHVRGEWFEVSEDEAVAALDEIAKAYPISEPTLAPGVAPVTAADTASDLSAEALALMLANMAGRYGVMARGQELDTLPFTGEVLIMEASWRLLQTDGEEGRRFFAASTPYVATNDDEDGSL